LPADTDEIVLVKINFSTGYDADRWLVRELTADLAAVARAPRNRERACELYPGGIRRGRSSFA
jgi:hypothetical protein